VDILAEQSSVVEFEIPSKIFKCWYWRIAKWLIGGKVAYSKNCSTS
jgi:hypothetical protein